MWNKMVYMRYLKIPWFRLVFYGTNLFEFNESSVENNLKSMRHASKLLSDWSAAKPGRVESTNLTRRTNR